ncbi:HPP family protein [Streptomyces oryzae]|uniref:HPP family protein n=1 Tax=Streptomyces oryzae TaxID=1434886 RepID=A0ABS3X7Z0_9ACTN|nr:HPP family protein [Streptomyces oryzae]
MRRSAAKRTDPGPPWVAGVRLLVLSAFALTVVGLVGGGVGWVWLTTALGPTAYLLLAHPESEGSQLRSAVLAHAAAIACGLACLAAFGLWNHPSVAETHRESLRQTGAQALAVGVTLLLLTLLRAPHPPAAATALLITSGITRPGKPLYGMLAGLALVIVLSAVLARVPGARPERGTSSAGP